MGRLSSKIASIFKFIPLPTHITSIEWSLRAPPRRVRALDLQTTMCADTLVAAQPLNPNEIPALMEITDVQALEYVVHLLHQLIESHEEAFPEKTGRRPSYDEYLELSSGVLNQLTPRASIFVDVDAPKDDDNTDPLSGSAEEMYKRFWLKEVPSISISDYLRRFHRYCHSSAATYLTAGCLIYYVSAELKSIPVTKRNVYRLFCAAFIVSAKFIEDKLYSMSRYATTAGLKKTELVRLELSFLLLIDFRVNADKEVLLSYLRKWASLNENA